MAESSETPRTVSRGIFLTIMAVLLAVLAISNTTKSLQHQNDPSHLGLVIFGYRLQTMAANANFNSVPAVYAQYMKMRRGSPLAIVYAFYADESSRLVVHGGEAHPSCAPKFSPLR